MPALQTRTCLSLLQKDDVHNTHAFTPAYYTLHLWGKKRKKKKTYLGVLEVEYALHHGGLLPLNAAALLGAAHDKPQLLWFAAGAQAHVQRLTVDSQKPRHVSCVQPVAVDSQSTTLACASVAHAIMCL
jgi:hypothetical protein